MFQRFRISAGGARVAIRRILVTRPWIYWSLVAIAMLGAAAHLYERTEQIEAERWAWGDVATVHVATRPLAAGDPLVTEPLEVPVAVAVDTAIVDPTGLIARQDIARGEVIVDVDVVAESGPYAMTPTGWLVVPIVESPSSGGVIGDRVRVVGDGLVMASGALVVGHHDDVTLVAVPEAEAAAIAAAGRAAGLTLLLEP